MAIRCKTTAPLPVPLLLPLQEDGFSCVPRCVKMVFMYIEETHNPCRVPNFDLEKIGDIVETMGDGTFPDKILNLNSVREISSARPSIEFEHKIKFHSLNELIEEIDDKQPPIAWILSQDTAKLHKFDHAVVVSNVENDRVYYNDPMFGKQSDPTDEFLAKWDEEDRVLVKVKIGKKKQKMLEDLLDEFNKQSQPIITGDGK